MKKTALKKIFFNYATVGFLEPSSYRAILKFLDMYIKVGPPEVLEKYQEYTKKLSHEVSKLIHCDPEEITYTKNTTEGIIIASEILPLKKGDEVLVMGTEYPANLLPWLKKRKDGVVVRTIQGKDNEEAFHMLLKMITPHTKAVAISWGQYYDGYLPDIELLSKTCLENGAYLVVDGVHGVGTRQLDLEKTHIDILSCGGQKHFGAIVGIGFLYVNKKIMPELTDFKVGIRSVKHFDQDGYALKDTAERFEDGTQNLLGIVSLHAAIKKINTIGMKQIQYKNMQLLRQFKKVLYRNTIPFIDYGDHQISVLSLTVSDPKALYEYLRQKGIYIKAVRDAARLSFSHMSNLSDFMYAVREIRGWMEETER